MGYPPLGCCPDNKSHEIILIDNKSNEYTPGQSCYKCNLPLDKIYFEKRLIRPFYYYCDQCPMIICFNCAQIANVTNKSRNKPNSRYLGTINHSEWNDPNLYAPRIWDITKPPSVDINRLKLNKIFENADDCVLNKYLRSIIKLFGTKELLQFITKHAPFEELDKIHKSIKKQQPRYMEYHKKPLFDENYFNKIPIECCQHVIGYIQRKDMKSFRMTSRQIAFQCIKHMRKVAIRIIYGPNILHDKNTSGHSLHHFFSVTRYNLNKTVSSLEAD